MSANNAAETTIGAIVLLTATGFLLYAAQSAGLRSAAGAYPLIASFRSVEGVSVGTDVRIAGITVGTVTDLALDVADYQARVTFTVDRTLQIPEDSSIIVSQEGLLGGTYLEITPGASDFTLASGDEILDTQSSVSLLNLLMRFGSGG